MSTTKPISILTVDDHPLLLAGISSMIQGEPDMRLAGEAESGKQAVEKFLELRPDVTLMDLQMPGMNGIEAIEIIMRHNSRARVIVLTTYGGDVLARRALKAGARGYILKSMIRRDLLDAIRAVHVGRRYIPDQVAAELAEYYAEDELSEREIEVLRSVADGRSNKMIADRLSISEATVKAHLKNIMIKLGASDRTHAVSIATIRGYLV